MTLKEAAQIYVDLIHLEESLAPDQHQAKQEVTALRSKYHDLFTQVLRSEGIACVDRFEATSRAMELVGFYNFLEVAKDLSAQLAPISRDLERVLKKIKATEKNKDTESLRDHLASLRVANIFRSHLRAIEFEKNCSSPVCSRTHDIILHPRQTDLVELVVEVARINEKKLDGDVIEEQHTERIDINNPKKGGSPRLFEEVRLLKENTSVPKEIVDLLVHTSAQLCPGQRNMIWVVSQNFLFDHADVEDAVWFLCGGHRQRPKDQADFNYSQPKHILGVGWLHEPTITTARPHFFPMANDNVISDFLRQSDFIVKELSVIKDGS